MRRKVAKALMAGGIICLMFSVGLLSYNNYQNKKAEAFSNAVMEVLRVMADEENNKPDPFDPTMTEKKIDGYKYVGYLYIPTLDLSLPTMSTWDKSRLKIAPCRYYGSTKTDNLVIAAHNYRYHFGFIGNLKKDDVVRFTDMDGVKYNYKVKKVTQVIPTDVDKVKDTGYELTLYTCTYGGARRIVVYCELVSIDAKA